MTLEMRNITRIPTDRYSYHRLPLLTSYNLKVCLLGVLSGYRFSKSSGYGVLLRNDIYSWYAE